jgi:hypothetical protein
VARTLLSEGALAAGGRVLAGGGRLALVGAEPVRGERLAGLLGRIFGGTRLLRLDSEAEAVIEALGAAPPVPPLHALIRHRLGRGPEGARFLRLEPDLAALARSLGPGEADPDRLAHAVRGLAERLARALPRMRPGPAGRLHLPVPESPAAEGLPSGCEGVVATLPLAAAADPAALAARRAGLAEAGIRLELDGVTAAHLPLLAPQPLPADLLRLHWSPELQAPGVMPLIEALVPSRLVLAGATSAEAQGWAAAAGISWIEEGLAP